MLFRQEKETFKNDQKIEIFQRVSTVFVKKSNFLSPLFFGQIKPQKNSFWKFWIKKECFLDQIRDVLKNSNPWKFFKGVSPCFLSKNGTILSCGFF